MKIQTVRKICNFICESCGVEQEFYFDIPEDFTFTLNFRFCSACVEERERKKNAEKTAEILTSRAVEAGIPELFWIWNPQIGKDKIKEWVLANANKNLFISGNFGCGKTSATANVAFEELKKNVKVCFCSFGDLANIAAAGVDKKNQLDVVISKMLSAELLIIDDICPRLTISDAVGNVLRTIIDSWYRRGDKMRLWITSNLSGRQIENKFENMDDGKRVIGRISRVIKSGKMVVFSS